MQKGYLWVFLFVLFFFLLSTFNISQVKKDLWPTLDHLKDEIVQCSNHFIWSDLKYYLPPPKIKPSVWVLWCASTFSVNYVLFCRPCFNTQRSPKTCLELQRYRRLLKGWIPGFSCFFSSELTSQWKNSNSLTLWPKLTLDFTWKIRVTKSSFSAAYVSLMQARQFPEIHLAQTLLGLVPTPSLTFLCL